MPEISKIKLPGSNQAYDIKDATARAMISGGVSFTVAWDGNSEPVVANIPAGVVVTYNDVEYTGTKSATGVAPGAFFLVNNGTGPNSFDEYYANNNAWELIGPAKVTMPDLGELAYLDASDVTESSDTFVKSYPGASSKMVQTSVPNVTAAGTPSTWAFQMGTDNTGSGGADESETLIITGANSTPPTLGEEIPVATGELDANGDGASVMTGLGTPTTGSAVTGVTFGS